MSFAKIFVVLMKTRSNRILFFACFKLLTRCTTSTSYSEPSTVRKPSSSAFQRCKARGRRCARRRVLAFWKRAKTRKNPKNPPKIILAWLPTPRLRASPRTNQRVPKTMIVDLRVRRTMRRHVCAFSTPRSLLIFLKQKIKTTLHVFQKYPQGMREK